MDTDQELERKFASLFPCLDERQRRLFAAAEARSLGSGGISRVRRASGLSRVTIQEALTEWDSPRHHPGRVRCPGGGRQKLRDAAPPLLKALEELIAPETRGDPMSPLRGTCKSTRPWSEALEKRGLTASDHDVGRSLHHLGSSLQATATTREGKQHPDRDAQFRPIHTTSGRSIAEGWPVIAVDTKKKELIGRYAHGGEEWPPAGQPEPVHVHDFRDPRGGKAIPHGVDDVGWDLGWVNVGCDHDTATFAVESIRQWWPSRGADLDQDAGRLLIGADGGGSNGDRPRRWKVELQRWAEETGREVTVCHLPPRTSKWTKIEHRLFSHITMNWRGRPRVSPQGVVALIAATRTATGLAIEARRDTGSDPTKVKVSKERMKQVRLKPHEFHGEWNSTIEPARSKL